MTSSNTTGQVELARRPSLSSFFPTVTPGRVASTTNAVMPLYPLSGCALAKTKKTPASALLLIQSFSPLITYFVPSEFGSAVVDMLNASLPLPASERQNEETVSVARRGSHFSCRARLPQNRMALLVSVFWMSTRMAKLASHFATSSTARQAEVKLISLPPNSAGISMPMIPCSNMDVRTEGIIFFSWSMERTWGASSVEHHFETMSRTASSSSVKRVRGPGGASSENCRRRWER